ncbi:PTS glucose transporter subunit IIA [Enterococcus pseudoavium]|uniref:PTS glucose transporter subunit IIA n=1 Tax=Enterococcus pseudoavium TaxID=44007 RepID=A0ABU3FJH3_9ENTE|nr:PTS glucose transporter subunit IIA [Enterococcus pseudoavium]MDT2753989.1 PTS glucose transporter subunit IIA [Enterococcus pseudoavium]MDT2771202.1 PTS glucose transporter subunit IIA [Enterococcus pseudoavium]
MFSMFKKKSQSTICSPADGQLTPLSEVSDPVFSQGMMGPGFAVEPTSNEIFSPITGTVTSIFPTKHAIGLEMSDGKEVLIHIGIDTVELQGQGFEILVSETNKVTPKTKLAVVDREYLKSQGKKSTIMVLFPSVTDTYSIQSQSVEASEEITFK